jgi:hypothetical protein
VKPAGGASTWMAGSNTDFHDWLVIWSKLMDHQSEPLRTDDGPYGAADAGTGLTNTHRAHGPVQCAIFRTAEGTEWIGRNHCMTATVATVVAGVCAVHTAAITAAAAAPPLSSLLLLLLLLLLMLRVLSILLWQLLQRLLQRLPLHAYLLPQQIPLVLPPPSLSLLCRKTKACAIE